MIKRFFHACRLWVGLFILTIATFILPEKIVPKKKTESKSGSVLELNEQLCPEKPIRFTDLHSYFEQLREPVDRTSAYITISHTLIKLAKKKNTPIRLNLSMTINFDKSGETGGEQHCYLSEYNTGKWRKLKELDISINSIVPLADEMIGAMAQNGWGCMDNSREQLQHYLLDCIMHNQNYALVRCKTLDITASIVVHAFIIVDVSEETMKNNRPRPAIFTKVSIKTDRDNPVESAQFIYFTRKPAAVEKPTS